MKTKKIKASEELVTNEVQRTPTPWMVDKEANEPCMVKITPVDDSVGICAVFGYNNKDANIDAAFIVRAVNSHNALLSVAKDSLNLLHAYLSNRTFQTSPDEETMLAKATSEELKLIGNLREIIAQAEGK